MSIELDAYGNFSYGKNITFEVYDYKPWPKSINAL
jgi:hypothetical protein